MQLSCEADTYASFGFWPSNASRSAARSALALPAGLRCFSTSAATLPTAITATLTCSVEQPNLFDHSRTE